jgi:hypothetical protein
MERLKILSADEWYDKYEKTCDTDLELMTGYSNYILDMVYEKLKMDTKTDNIGYNEMLSDKIHELKQQL